MLLYHRKKAPFMGTTLLPLSELTKQFPDLSEKEVSKYEDRPFLINKRIEPLNCTWADVLHLTPIHPEKMKAALLAVGYTDLPMWEYFEIQSDRLDAARLAYHVSDFTYAQPVYTEKPATFEREVGSMPEAAIAYYKQEFAAGRFPLVWAHTWHVLYNGTIDVTDAPVRVI